MHRFYFDGQAPENLATLDAEESRHAVQVLRMRGGENVVLLDGQGGVYSAQIEKADAAGVTARILEQLPSRESETDITLYQGMPKADKMEWIIQKCTELGVKTFCPVMFSRCVKEMGKNPEKILNRWSRIAREAAKQCGRGRVPEILPPISAKELYQRLKEHELSLTAWEDAEGTRIAHVLENARDVALVIGPEGGLDEGEVEAMKQSGCRVVTLGSRILRTETAGMAAVSSILTLRGEL